MYLVRMYRKADGRVSGKDSVGLAVPLADVIQKLAAVLGQVERGELEEATLRLEDCRLYHLKRPSHFAPGRFCKITHTAKCPKPAYDSPVPATVTVKTTGLHFGLAIAGRDPLVGHVQPGRVTQAARALRRREFTLHHRHLDDLSLAVVLHGDMSGAERNARLKDLRGRLRNEYVLAANPETGDQVMIRWTAKSPIPLQSARETGSDPEYDPSEDDS